MNENKGMKVLKIYSIVVLSICIIIGLFFTISALTTPYTNTASSFGGAILQDFGFSFGLFISNIITLATITIFIPLVIAVVSRNNYTLKNIVLTVLTSCFIISIIAPFLPSSANFVFFILDLKFIQTFLFGFLISLLALPFVTLPPLIYLHLSVKDFKEKCKMYDKRIISDEDKVKEQNINDNNSKY